MLRHWLHPVFFVPKQKLFIILLAIMPNAMTQAQDGQTPFYSDPPPVSNVDTTYIMELARKGKSLQVDMPDSALFWLGLSLKLSQEHHFIDGMAYNLGDIGLCYIIKGEQQKGLYYLQKAIPYTHKARSYTYLAATNYGNLGAYYNGQGNYRMAALYFDSAIREERKWSNNTNDLFYLTTLNNLSVVHYRIKRYDQALEYAKQVVAGSRQKGHTRLLAQALSNQAEIYAQLNNPGAALTFFKESLVLSRANHLKRDELATLNALANFMLQQGNPLKALAYIKESGEIGPPKPPYYLSIFQRYTLGKIYARLKQYDKAAAELKEALADAEMYRIADEKMDAHRELSEVYRQDGQYEKAMQQRLIYESLKDSFLSREKARDINELNIRFRTAEKDRELMEKKLNIAQANALSRKKTTWIWISSLGTLVMALLALLIRYRHKNKEIRLIQQKELELLRAAMEGEEKERIRVGKELHDGVSGFLSAIKMNLVSLRLQRGDITDETAYNNAVLLADEAADELRKTAHNLVPALLSKNGLSEAIMGFCQRLSQPGGLQMQAGITGTPWRMDPEKELTIYRIIQELLHNILKHAQATIVKVAVNWLDDILIISIEDDGTVQLQDNDALGLGMDNIVKRIKSAHGNIEIDKSDTGTSLYLYFPLEGSEE